MSSSLSAVVNVAVASCCCRWLHSQEHHKNGIINSEIEKERERERQILAIMAIRQKKKKGPEKGKIANKGKDKMSVDKYLCCERVKVKEF